MMIFPELFVYKKLEKIISKLGDSVRISVVDQIEHRNQIFPLYVLELGSQDLEAPVVAYVGGVHGLEKIGSEVILSYLETISSLIDWDKSFQKRLRHSRMLFMPIVNPIGILRKTRSNGDGIDIMRNAPIDTAEETSFLYKGHRLSPNLPFYRGKKGEPMAKESQALCRVVREKIFPSKLSVVIDIHSGFGLKDRFWFPHATSRKLFYKIGNVMAFKDLFDHTFPNHFYVIEPVSQQYTIHGDIWDYLAEEYYSNYRNAFFPWTLEMGSWTWLKKNPIQLLNKSGLYHPMIKHRSQRVLRRHFTLFDFTQRSILFPEQWMDLNDSQEKHFTQLAKEKWYSEN